LQIQTVITNLILNARDAVGNSGRILVETRSSESWVTLAVSDNGCGMASEFIHEHLFRPFQTTKRNGIGIGMFHCKMIVDAHHGRIDVESRKGNGTSFRVSFPCRRESSHSFLDLRSEPASTRSGAVAQKRLLHLDCRRAGSPAIG
jgi:signal transduction histidine kinase